MGGSQMELQVVSDTTGIPVQQGAPAVSAVFRTGCNAMDFQATDTLYFERVSERSSGWFDLPSLLGGFNLTVGYAGDTYLFQAASDPASTSCVTLAVPSGMVTLTTYQFSNYDCSGNLGAWAGQSTYACFGEVYLRVLSDSDSASIAEANVTTAYDFPQTCYPNPTPCQNSSICGEGFKSFMTNSTEWYAFGDSTDSFSVVYGGQTYVVTASQRAASTCETLHVPSGTVGTTYGPGCVGGEPSTTNSNSTTSNSSTTSASSPISCGAPPSTQLNWGSKGDIYMKVVTDEGTVITNGTLVVHAVALASNGDMSGTSNYWVGLGYANVTGYSQLALNANFTNSFTNGYYYLTLVASYNNTGPCYTATLPPIQVHPNSTVYVTVSIPSGVVTVVTSNAGSGGATTTTTSVTTGTSTIENQYNCGVWVYKLTPVQNSSLYLKLVNSQGAAITGNGTAFVFHSAPPGNGYPGATGAEYCVALNGNATGFMALTANDGLQPIGSYGLTLLSGHGQVPSYNMTVPPITVPAGTTVYVTVVVPSGEVTEVSCTQGNSCTTETFVAVGG